MALTSKLDAIGDAIRLKTGGTDKLTLAQMPDEIAGIQSAPFVKQSTEYKFVLANEYTLKYNEKNNASELSGAIQKFIQECEPLIYISSTYTTGTENYKVEGYPFNRGTVYDFPTWTWRYGDRYKASEELEAIAKPYITICAVNKYGNPYPEYIFNRTYYQSGILYIEYITSRSANKLTFNTNYTYQTLRYYIPDSHSTYIATQPNIYAISNGEPVLVDTAT